MSSEELPPDQIKEPKPLRLLIVGVVVIAAAAAAVFMGVKAARARIRRWRNARPRRPFLRST